MRGSTAGTVPPAAIVKPSRGMHAGCIVQGNWSLTAASVASRAAITNASATTATCRRYDFRAECDQFERQRWRASDQQLCARHTAVCCAGGQCSIRAGRGRHAASSDQQSTSPLPPSPPVTTSASRRRSAQRRAGGRVSVQGLLQSGRQGAGRQLACWLSGSALLPSVGTHLPAARAGAVSTLQAGWGGVQGWEIKHHASGRLRYLGPLGWLARLAGVSPPERKHCNAFTGPTSVQCSPGGRPGAASASWRKGWGVACLQVGLQAAGKGRENGAGGVATPALVAERRHRGGDLGEAGGPPRRRLRSHSFDGPSERALVGSCPSTRPARQQRVATVEWLWGAVGHRQGAWARPPPLPPLPPPRLAGLGQR